MKFKHLTAIALTAMAIISCDEGTGTVGDSLTSASDNLLVTYSEFNVLTNSFVPDSVYSYNEECYLGKVSDPETGSIVKSNFMFQFNMMENKHLPDESQMAVSDDGKVVADSCKILLFFDEKNCFGDTLAALKIKVSELEKPIADGIHYTNFDPAKSGYVRQNGIKKYLTFSMHNMNDEDEDTGTPLHFIDIRLNEPYTDKDGVTYNNYGTYILRKFYDHPEFFKNSYAFIHNICPGFYAEVIDGEGFMAKFYDIGFRVYYHYHSQTAETDYSSFMAAASTQEVLQTITVQNDKEALKQLAADNTCTYMKTPAGIFTEVTLPVDEIKNAHTSDSLLSASVVFNRINNDFLSDYSFKSPQCVMLIHKDSVNHFFENTRNYNNLYAFYTTLSKNAYSFSSSSDISNLLVRMYNAKQQGLKNDPAWVEKHPNWNKAMLIPVHALTASSTTTTTTTSTTASAPIALTHEMSMTSTRLVKGTNENPIKLKVVYAKFND